jgi:hypothetical protein
MQRSVVKGVHIAGGTSRLSVVTPRACHLELPGANGSVIAPRMRSLCLLLALLVAAAVPAHAGPNLRIMAPAELVASSVIIARARVVDVDESDWADFKQVVTLELVDVIEGDFTLERVRVAARSLVAYTNDRYAKKEEWLVFLSHEAGLYRTVNYQYGQFRIEGDVVRAWRNAENVAADKPYYSVREEIERLLTEMRTPPPPPVPDGGQPAPQGRQLTPQRPGQPPPRQAPPRVERPERP